MAELDFNHHTIDFIYLDYQFHQTEKSVLLVTVYTRPWIPQGVAAFWTSVPRSLSSCYHSLYLCTLGYYNVINSHFIMIFPLFSNTKKCFYWTSETQPYHWLISWLVIIWKYLRLCCCRRDTTNIHKHHAKHSSDSEPLHSLFLWPRILPTPQIPSIHESVNPLFCWLLSWKMDY